MLAEAIGAVFVAFAMYYLILYFMDTANSLSQDYFIGASIGLLYMAQEHCSLRQFLPASFEVGCHVVLSDGWCGPV